MREKLTNIFLLVVLVILDQVSKWLFYDLKFLNDFYFINWVLNKGISWWITFFPYFFVVLLTLFFLVVIFYFWWNKKISNLVFVLLFAWALGNLIDRIFLWGVRDFIDLHFWPVFNLADVYLTIGVLILIYKNLTKDKNHIK